MRLTAIGLYTQDRLRDALVTRSRVASNVMSRVRTPRARANSLYKPHRGVCALCRGGRRARRPRRSRCRALSLHTHTWGVSLDSDALSTISRSSHGMASRKRTKIAEFRYQNRHPQWRNGLVTPTRRETPPRRTESDAIWRRSRNSGARS